MKIVHVCLCGDVFSEKYAYQDNILPKYHKLMGNEVSIIAPTYSEYSKTNGNILSVSSGIKIIENGIQLIRLKPALPISINQHLHLFHNMGKVIDDIKPDLIFVHGVISLNYRYFKKYKKKHPNVKIVYDNHADFNNSSRNKWSYYYSRYFIRHFVVDYISDTTNIFYGVTPARCAFLHEMYGVPQSKIHLLPMGADDEEMHWENKEKIREEVRKKYDISDEDFLVVTGGKIDPLKNIHILAQSISNSKYKNIKILIFGNIREDLQDTFNSLKSDRVILIGWQPSNQVYRYFYAADLVVFPGLHSVLWEQAVASQVPCAFTKIDGFDHVDYGGNCILMEGKGAEYYQSLIESLYLNKDTYRQLYLNAHSSNSKQFLYSSIAQKVLDDLYN